jgi:hypothetical protein
MTTIEMLEDWKLSDYQRKYITKSHWNNMPYTVYNNGCGVLFHSYFKITLNAPIKKSEPFYINNKNLEWEWEELIEEYTIEEAYQKHENGWQMISLENSKLLILDETYTKDEILGKWIQKIQSCPSSCCWDLIRCGSQNEGPVWICGSWAR